MDNTIEITVPGEELENLTIQLSVEEVTALYKLRKELNTKITEQGKRIKDLERDHKWASNSRDTARQELRQAHTLLTALGIPDKTEAEESYNRHDLEMTTRIALFLSKVHND